MAAYRRVYDSHHLQLTAKNRDQLRNPALGNRVWATFFYPLVTNCTLVGLGLYPLVRSDPIGRSFALIVACGGV